MPHNEMQPHPGSWYDANILTPAFDNSVNYRQTLDEQRIQLIELALRSYPSQYGLAGNLWDGKLLSHFIGQQFGVDLGVRQCQRMFRRLGFRLRKPRPLIAKADPERQEAFKKNH